MTVATAAAASDVSGRDRRGQEAAGRGARDAAGGILVEDVGAALGVEAGVEDGFEHCCGLFWMVLYYSLLLFVVFW